MPGWQLSGYIPQDQIGVIAGMSSFSVAYAVLGEHDISKNAIIIAEPEQLNASELLIQSAAEKVNVLVLFRALSIPGFTRMTFGEPARQSWAKCWSQVI
jgi:hypothetical protein